MKNKNLKKSGKDKLESERRQKSTKWLAGGVR